MRSVTIFHKDTKGPCCHPQHLCVSQSSPEKQNKTDMHIEIYFKKLAHVIVEVGDRNPAGLASRLET